MTWEMMTALLKTRMKMRRMKLLQKLCHRMFLVDRGLLRKLSSKPTPTRKLKTKNFTRPCKKSRSVRLTTSRQRNLQVPILFFRNR